jgi:hypothetical protein
MAIPADTRLRNPTHVSHLPRSWGTLYELSRLDDQALERLLGDGTINPEVTRGDVVNAVAKLTIARAATARGAVGRELQLSIRHEERPSHQVNVTPLPPEIGTNLIEEAARGRALRIWDALLREGPADDALSEQLQLIPSERPEAAALVRQMVDCIAVALIDRTRPH